ncbi:MAG: DUF4450 domain-containing protein, partial [Planctomycetes bacterium]|nr:DUF4450 domain-containing protein [Planctomycetota bacterium]
MHPNLLNAIDRPLRYRPDGTDFVTENGAEFFNRPLYGGNTAFRVDAGDKPEFALYLPGRGGNLRFGLRAADGSKWLHEAEHVLARYRPGAMLYEVHDPLFGREGVVRLAVLALHTVEGLVARVEASGIRSGLELLWAFGGVNGQRGQRDGDIGTESVPISEFFQLRPEFCAGNSFAIGANTFTLRAKAATVSGLVPAGAHQTIADATKWASAADLLASAGGTPNTPVVMGRVALTGGAPLFLALQRLPGDSAMTAALPTDREVTAGDPGPDHGPARLTPRPILGFADLPALFNDADTHSRAVREQVVVDTPDPFLNAAVAAVCIAADGVWDEPSATV